MLLEILFPQPVRISEPKLDEMVSDARALLRTVRDIITTTATDEDTEYDQPPACRVHDRLV